MQHDGEAGQALAYFFEDIESELRLLAGLELIGAVAGADGDGEGIAARLFGELAHFVGMGEAGVFRLHVDGVFDAGELPQLRLDHHAALMRVFDHLPGDLDILFERMVRSVDHDGGKAVVHGRFAGFKICAVVQVQHDGQARRLHGCFHQVLQVYGVRVFACACGYL